MKKYFYGMMVFVLALVFAAPAKVCAQVSTQRANAYIWDDAGSQWWRAQADPNGSLYVHVASAPPVQVSVGQLELWLNGVSRSTGTDAMITRMDSTYSRLGSSIPAESAYYQNKVSTGTAGKILVSGSLVLTNCDMDAYSFYSVGGDTLINSNWAGGTIYALQGIPISTTLQKPVPDPTYDFSMSYGTTLYYIFTGAN